LFPPERVLLIYFPNTAADSQSQLLRANNNAHRSE